MESTKPFRVRTISEYHRLAGLPKPEHPLVSVINLEQVEAPKGPGPRPVVLDFYSISIKRCVNAKFRYGQQEYDFDEGVMFFIAPGQVFGIDYDDHEPAQRSGWMLAIHPDFLWNTPLAKAMRRYEFFDYSVNEALFLSEKEEAKMTEILTGIQMEYRGNIDDFSHGIIIAQVELLLTYSKRFYHRQFITRRTANHRVLNRLEALLAEYYADDNAIEKGLPTVQFLADNLHMSPNYLSSLLKELTGQSTQQHIHDALIQKAKEMLSTTDLSVTEIAYGLGFEHPQSFSKLFRSKTNLSPSSFRRSFN